MHGGLRQQCSLRRAGRPPDVLWAQLSQRSTAITKCRCVLALMSCERPKVYQGF